jgi:uncharacterized membrane protein
MWVRCKVCGYLIKEGDLRDKCPACGANRSVFEKYTDPVAAPRRRILNLHLHPIAVHFPTTFAVAAFVFSVAIPFLSGEAQTLLISTTKIISIFLPVVIILAFWVGWWDGTLRFRKIKNSQILKRKIVYACVLFAVSLGLVALVWEGDFGTWVSTMAVILLSAVAIVFAILLGLLGMSIAQAAFPGK